MDDKDSLSKTLSGMAVIIITKQEDRAGTICSKGFWGEVWGLQTFIWLSLPLYFCCLTSSKGETLLKTNATLVSGDAGKKVVMGFDLISFVLKFLLVMFRLLSYLLICSQLPIVLGSIWGQFSSIGGKKELRSNSIYHIYCFWSIWKVSWNRKLLECNREAIWIY